MLKRDFRIIWILLLSNLMSISYGQQRSNKILMPVIDGDWWEITGNPNLGKYTSQKQQPVDFGIWQAADGTWQLWSCIRGTKAGGRTRLFYRWESQKITDKNWVPKGIAMESDTSLGEEKSGLQAPFVLKEGKRYYMFYGDWNRICLATSQDGKSFTRVLNEQHSPALFSGPMYNTRDPMVIKIKDTFYCYYSGHLEKDIQTNQLKCAVFCRTSKDLRSWSKPVIVAGGGTPAKETQWYGGDAECPFVVHLKNRFILFRNHIYGQNNLNTQYCSSNPLNFGKNDDQYMVGQLSVAAPEIIKVKQQYYIIALKPSLDGIRVAKLRFIEKGQ